MRVRASERARARARARHCSIDDAQLRTCQVVAKRLGVGGAHRAGSDLLEPVGDSEKWSLTKYEGAHSGSGGGLIGFYGF